MESPQQLADPYMFKGKELTNTESTELEQLLNVQEEKEKLVIGRQTSPDLEGHTTESPCSSTMSNTPPWSAAFSL